MLLQLPIHFLYLNFILILLTALNIIDKPPHIFNLDKIAMFIDPSRQKAVEEKGKNWPESQYLVKYCYFNDIC